MTIEALRAVEQPDYAAATAKSAYASEQLKEAIAEQGRLDEAARLKWKAAGWRAIVAFVTLTFFVWVAGLLIETGWLGIRIAGDVRRLSADSRMS